MTTIKDKISIFQAESAISSLKKSVEHSNKVVFSTSFGKEDQVITHLIAESKLPITIFTLDTGRLFEETYAVFDRTIQKYKIKIKTYYPNQEKVEELVSKKGPYSFYDSVENRKECCGIRKIQPLKRALQGFEVWITGLRKSQSENRQNMEQVEWDAANKIIKIHPLFHWSDEELDRFIDNYTIPVNSLHAKGYPSIGCSSCTRAVLEGEDSRAGRWWWENSKKECGLHQSE